MKTFNEKLCPVYSYYNRWFNNILLLKTNQEIHSIKKNTLLISVFAFILTELGRSFYRPYIYANNINDYFVADTIGNSFGTVMIIFFILTIVGKETKKDFIQISFIILGLLIYEAINLISNHPFDINDIVSTILFGLLSIFTYWILLKRKKTTATD